MIIENIDDTGNKNQTIFYYKGWFCVKGSETVHHTSDENFVAITRANGNINGCSTDDVFNMATGGINEHDTFITIVHEHVRKDDDIINDENMREEIINDVMERYGVDKGNAIRFADTYGSDIVDAMWAEYSNMLQSFSNGTYHG